MSTRLDLALQKYPGHEEGIRLLAARDPSGNLKYLDWGAKILASGQALAPEVADVTEMFERFRGQWVGRRAHRRPGQRILADLYAYGPSDLAKLRGLLLTCKRAQTRKRKQRERLYRLESAIEAETVYDSPDLVVRHIQNKSASVHYGSATKWCISMLREGYFEDYEAHNATFFFFERKAPLGDEFDKVALMVPRGGHDPHGRESTADAFTTLDRRVDMLSLARVYGPRVFEIFRLIHEASERYPGSVMSQVYAGTASAEQLQAAFDRIASGDCSTHGAEEILTSICCNDATPLPLLETIAERATSLVQAEHMRIHGRVGYRRRYRFQAKAVLFGIKAAMVIHPNIPAERREQIAKDLRRRHVRTDVIRRVTEGGRVRIEWESHKTMGTRYRHRSRRLTHTVKGLRKRAAMCDRMAKRMRRRARTLQRKLSAKKKAEKARAALRRATQRKGTR